MSVESDLDVVEQKAVSLLENLWALIEEFEAVLKEDEETSHHG